ncbi:hypothetical protein, partial [Kocuria sp.]|uniref:hypothetical protein n=1 Tax=Kocuria sp. TaxID=1871328 RepID=UPI0026DF5E23
GAADYWDARVTSPVQVGQGRNAARFKEYLHHGGKVSASVRFALLDWVRPGAVFEVHIDVDSLTGLELGALLWLLDNPDEDVVHQMGSGKPLGFGAAKIRVDWSKTAVRSTKAVTRRYAVLSSGEDPDAAPLSEQQLKKLSLERFSAVVSATQGLREGVEDWSKAARGVPGLPVHYPRPGDNAGKATAPGEKIYEWFTQNNKRKHPDYLPQPGGTLPYLDRDKADQQNNPNNRGRRPQNNQRNGRRGWNSR